MVAAYQNFITKSVGNRKEEKKKEANSVTVEAALWALSLQFRSDCLKRGIKLTGGLVAALTKFYYKVSRK